MNLLHWSDDMSVGNAALDEDHRQLFRLLAELHDDIANHAVQDGRDRLAQLAAYAKLHFRKEEALLRSHGYPRLTAHQSMHDALAQDLAEALMDQAEGPDPDLITKLYNFTLNWLRHHILEEDMAYSEFLIGKTPKIEQP